MASFIQETPAGQFLRFLGLQNTWLQYPEEAAGFQPADMSVVQDQSPSPVQDDQEKAILAVVAREKSVTPRSGSPSPAKEVIIVSWTKNDPANPRNWPQSKKMWTLTVVNLYTFCVYCTASIITPTAQAIMQRYDVSLVVASLGLSMYVVGCKFSIVLATKVSLSHVYRRRRTHVPLSHQ
jgi:MFS transporter, DHA1 family, multidrug resistance protein